jgi:hypothetical protein
MMPHYHPSLRIGRPGPPRARCSVVCTRVRASLALGFTAIPATLVSLNDAEEGFVYQPPAQRGNGSRAGVGQAGQYSPEMSTRRLHAPNWQFLPISKIGRPCFIGAPGRIRTADTLVRSHAAFIS